jgi:hypothetical protein
MTEKLRSKMTNPSTRTRNFMQWIKEKEKSGIVNKVALCRKFVEEKQGNYKTFQNAYSHLHYGKAYENGRKNHNLKKTNFDNSKPKYINAERCFFYDTEECEEHHISYTPEVIVHLSERAHQKIHVLLREYHSQIVAKDVIIAELQTHIKEIQKVVNTNR